MPYAQLVRGFRSLIKSSVTKEILVQQVPQYFDFGTPFILHLYEMFPDLVTIAKGLTSAYLPPPGVIVVKLVWEAIEQIPEKLGPMRHGCNYSGHPLWATRCWQTLKFWNGIT